MHLLPPPLIAHTHFPVKKKTNLQMNEFLFLMKERDHGKKSRLEKKKKIFFCVKSSKTEYIKPAKRKNTREGEKVKWGKLTFFSVFFYFFLSFFIFCFFNFFFFAPKTPSARRKNSSDESSFFKTVGFLYVGEFVCPSLYLLIRSSIWLSFKY